MPILTGREAGHGACFAKEGLAFHLARCLSSPLGRIRDVMEWVGNALEAAWFGLVAECYAM